MKADNGYLFPRLLPTQVVFLNECVLQLREYLVFALQFLLQGFNLLLIRQKPVSNFV